MNRISQEFKCTIYIDDVELEGTFDIEGEECPGLSYGTTELNVTAELISAQWNNAILPRSILVDATNAEDFANQEKIAKDLFEQAWFAGDLEAA